MLHAGIGPTDVNALLSSINIPAVASSTIKEIGPAIEKVAKTSCLDSMEEEKTDGSWTDRNKTVGKKRSGHLMTWDGKKEGKATTVFPVIVQFSVSFFFLKHLYMKSNTGITQAF